ncbi:MAG: hypothetical protein M1834_009172 [Cirrosporium novae-zelandiae]|nr:MAG: hypothetical protein M1834_009172 [Cirrosporium novae-zelandiae]
MASSSASDTDLAAAALATALAALLIAIGQLLQQYFATADGGYRRCQSSVMGPWAKRTHLRWRWSQFRFETIFTTPFISLYPFNKQSVKVIGPRYDRAWVVGGMCTEQSKKAHSLVSGKHGENIDSATWLRFLRAIYKGHELLLKDSKRVQDPEKGFNFEFVTAGKDPDPTLTMPIVEFEERSWDFMPPEVVKPYARIGVSDIAILVRRLGMNWMVFDPHEGTMRAEGNGFVLTSTTVRSVGTMLYFTSTGREVGLPLEYVMGRRVKDLRWIPKARADAMTFGVLLLSYHPYFGRLRYDISSRGHMIETLHSFIRIPDTLNKFEAELPDEPLWIPGFSDIVALVLPVLKERESSLFRVPNPGSSLQCLLSHDCVAPFESEVRELIRHFTPYSPLSVEIAWVLDSINALNRLDPTWCSLSSNDRNEREITSLQLELYDTCASISEYFEDLEKEYSGHRTGHHPFFYLNLAHCHIQRMILDVNWYRTPGGSPNIDVHIADIMREYFGCLPRIIEDMAEYYDFGNEGIITVAWVKMIFRAILWHRLHFLQSGPIIPSQHYESQLPVYIG